jgi:hypothetical protein
MYATQYFEAKILNTFNNITATGVGSLYVALFMSSPTNTGQAGVEVNYSGYTRQPVQFTAPYEESGGIGVRNNADLLWQPAPGDVGQARFIGIYDSATAGSGNMLLYGELSVPLDIRAGQQPSIYRGDILYYIQGQYSKYFMTAIMNVLRNQNLPGFVPHMALFDGDPETVGVELSGGAYARPVISFGAPTVQVGGQTQIQSTNVVRFPSPTSTWGNWAWSGIKDAINGGNLVTKLANPAPEVLQANYVPQINIGDCKAALS